MSEILWLDYAISADEYFLRPPVEDEPLLCSAYSATQHWLREDKRYLDGCLFTAKIQTWRRNFPNCVLLAGLGRHIADVLREHCRYS